MVKKELVAARLEKIREYLKTLNIIQKHDLQKFKNDTFIHATAEPIIHLDELDCLDLLNDFKEIVLHRQLRAEYVNENETLFSNI